MIRAYNELYLNDAQLLLANAFDYALNTCNLSPDWFARVFASSKPAREFERGNPAFISGKSAEEFVRDILSSVLPGENLPSPVFSQDRSPAYWAGWALAYYQWFSAKSFKSVFSRIPLTDILAMYRVYHEMDVTNFAEDMDRKFDSVTLDTNLKRIREARGLSQNKLADLSGVKKRSIQLYEQKVNDIDKAQAQTLFKLSRILGCEIEDLLENPQTV